jgi:hypothetical protein
MKTKYTNQLLISGLLVVLSVSSLLMLLLQLRAPGISGDRLARAFQSGGTVMKAYALFDSGALTHVAYGPGYLLVSLSLIALISLLSFHSERQSQERR